MCDQNANLRTIINKTTCVHIDQITSPLHVLPIDLIDLFCSCIKARGHWAWSRRGLSMIFAYLCLFLFSSLFICSGLRAHDCHVIQLLSLRDNVKWLLLPYVLVHQRIHYHQLEGAKEMAFLSQTVLF